jgi:hypothetical protein
MSKERQNKGYEKPFFQPINKQRGWFFFCESIQNKMNVARKARTKKH